MSAKSSARTRAYRADVKSLEITPSLQNVFGSFLVKTGVPQKGGSRPTDPTGKSRLLDIKPKPRFFGYVICYGADASALCSLLSDYDCSCSAVAVFAVAVGIFSCSCSYLLAFCCMLLLRNIKLKLKLEIKTRIAYSLIADVPWPVEKEQHEHATWAWGVIWALALAV